MRKYSRGKVADAFNLLLYYPALSFTRRGKTSFRDESLRTLFLFLPLSRVLVNKKRRDKELSARRFATPRSENTLSRRVGMKRVA